MDFNRSNCVNALVYLDESHSQQIDIETKFRRPFTTVIVTVRHQHEIGLGGWVVGIGIAKCNGKDAFSPWEGHDIAKKRAFRFIADDPDSREIVFETVGESYYSRGG